MVVGGGGSKVTLVFCFGPKPKLCSLDLDLDQAEQKVGNKLRLATNFKRLATSLKRLARILKSLMTPLKKVGKKTNNLMIFDTKRSAK